MAPGPPDAMAAATPAILPVPIVAASAVQRLWNWLIRMCSYVLVSENTADRVVHPVTDVCYLKKSGQAGHQDTGSDQKDEHGKTPHESVDGGIDTFD